jgi:hypothetical protein
MIFKTKLGLDEETASNIMKVAMAYIVGQGVADLGKEKASNISTSVD